MSSFERWHRVLDEAQARWSKGDLQGLGYREFIDRFDAIRRKAVLLGFLYYQVRRGGFAQWIGNGYALYVDELTEILKEIGTLAATEAAAILELLAPHLDTKAEWRGARGHYWKSKQAPDAGWFRQYEKRFYAVDEQLGQDIEAWLQERLAIP
jgi:hypothetical protein